VFHGSRTGADQSSFTDSFKDRSEFTREDLLKVIFAKNIERLTFHYTALDGKLKELKIPVTDRKLTERILADGDGRRFVLVQRPR